MTNTGEPSIAGLKAINRAPVDPPSAEVARVLLDYILSGQVGPGEKLPSERRLVESLGVSRSVVREGIKSLGLLGLVDFRHGGGTYLRSTESELLPKAIEWGLLLGRPRVVDLIEARGFLEVALAGLAAERRSEEQLDAIEAAMATMAGVQGVDEFVEADVAFHLAVAAASGNGALSDMHASISSLLRVWIHRNMTAADSAEVPRREHRAILEAIRVRDVDGARAAMQGHMTGASARLMATLGDTAAPD